MRLTDKDKELIKLIDRWGFMSVKDICKIQGYKNENLAVWRLKRLVENHLIKREKSVFGYYFYVPADFRGVDLATVEHDQTAMHLCLALCRMHKVEYLTIRELRSAARVNEGVVGLSRKVPDFVLVNKDGQQIACEVELSQKSLTRQRENIGRYVECLARNEYSKVWYFCGSGAILERVKGLIQERKMGQRLEYNLISAIYKKEGQ